MRNKIFNTASVYFLLFIFALIFVLPLLFMIAGSLKPDDMVLSDMGSAAYFNPENFSFKNYRDVFERIEFTRFMLNSVFITGAIVISSLIVNSLAGYSFARLKWKGRSFFLIFVIALMILPLESIAVPLFYQMVSIGWRNTYRVQIVPFAANAFSIYLFYTFFLALPKELEESAKIDGAGAFRTFLSIIVPVSKPVYGTVTILMFLMYWGSYLWPLMVTSGPDYRPLPLAIASFKTLPPIQWGDIMAFGVMMVLPVLIVFIIFQRFFVRGVAASGVKS
ncbi:MAG: carbohydrate ABC transporter permease [Fibrobacterota bacterium]